MVVLSTSLLPPFVTCFASRPSLETECLVSVPILKNVQISKPLPPPLPPSLPSPYYLGPVPMINRVLPPAVGTCICLLQLGLLFVTSPNGGQGDSAEAEAEEDEEDRGGGEEEEDADLEGKGGRGGREGGREDLKMRTGRMQERRRKGGCVRGQGSGRQR